MKKIISILLTVVLLVLQTTVFSANMGKSRISSAGAFVMDYNTGEELYSYKADISRAPGSMTKIMTVYVILEAIKNGEISYDTVTRISPNTYNISRNSRYQSVLPLDYDTDYRVDELIDVVIVYSACGAALALAELLCGSEQEFVKRMNATSWRMGIDAQFFDCMGIANNHMTPRAMATLTRYTVYDFPEILEITKQKSVQFHGRTYSTTNRLLNSYYYHGADGIKTGTTSYAGYCFCGTAQKDGERVIAVTMASSSRSQRFIDTRLMLDYGFERIKENRNIYTSDIKTYINGSEIPAFATKKDGGETVIIAEDLHAYGYDYYYEAAEKTLYITHNPLKAHSTIPMDYYHGLLSGQPFMKYYLPATVKVVIRKNNKEITVPDSLMLDGYMAIPAKSLKDLSSQYTEDGNTINITY